MVPEMISEALENVNDRESFLHFVQMLSSLAPRWNNGVMTGGVGWESQDISGYLESSAAWARDSKFQITALDNPWSKMAEFLYVGMIYE